MKQPVNSSMANGTLYLKKKSIGTKLANQDKAGNNSVGTTDDGRQTTDLKIIRSLLCGSAVVDIDDSKFYFRWVVVHHANNTILFFGFTQSKSQFIAHFD